MLCSVFCQAFSVKLRWAMNKESDLAQPLASSYVVHKVIGAYPDLDMDFRFKNRTTAFNSMSTVRLVNYTSVRTELRGLSGVNKFYVTAINSSGLESPISNIVEMNGPDKSTGTRLVAK